jgi:hypothetical protein
MECVGWSRRGRVGGRSSAARWGRGVDLNGKGEVGETVSRDRRTASRLGTGRDHDRVANLGWPLLRGGDEAGPRHLDHRRPAWGRAPLARATRPRPESTRPANERLPPSAAIQPPNTAAHATVRPSRPSRPSTRRAPPLLRRPHFAAPASPTSRSRGARTGRRVRSFPPPWPSCGPRADLEAVMRSSRRVPAHSGAFQTIRALVEVPAPLTPPPLRATSTPPWPCETPIDTSTSAPSRAT